MESEEIPTNELTQEEKNQEESYQLQQESIQRDQIQGLEKAQDAAKDAVESAKFGDTTGAAMAAESARVAAVVDTSMNDQGTYSSSEITQAAQDAAERASEAAKEAEEKQGQNPVDEQKQERREEKQENQDQQQGIQENQQEFDKLSEDHQLDQQNESYDASVPTIEQGVDTLELENEEPNKNQEEQPGFEGDQQQETSQSPFDSEANYSSENLFEGMQGVNPNDDIIAQLTDHLANELADAISMDGGHEPEQESEQQQLGDNVGQALDNLEQGQQEDQEHFDSQSEFERDEQQNEQYDQGPELEIGD